MHDAESIPADLILLMLELGLIDGDGAATDLCGQQPPVRWEEQYDGRTQRWAWNLIETEVNDPCKSHFRVARHDDKPALVAYFIRRDDGCCGYYDEVHRGPDGHKYLIGFNYGH